MLIRSLPRFCRPFSYPEIHAHSCCQVLPTRKLHNGTRIADPPVNGAAANVSLAHPRDPGAPRPSSSVNNQGNSTTSDATSGQLSIPATPPLSSPPPGDGSEAEHTPIPDNFAPVLANPPPAQSPLPSPNQAPQARYANPPFNTHKFFTVLEYSFPTPKARALMRATRALLIDRLGAVKREALTIKDLESVCLFISA